MNPIHRTTIGLALIAAASALVASAGPAGADPATAPAAPVPASEFRLVIKDVAILDGAGATLDSFHCEWTEPEDDDAPCLSFSGDPKSAYAKIADAGGSSATVATTVPDLDIDLLTRIGRRSDGTWLFRTQGTSDGKPYYAGWVCTADGHQCRAYEAKSKRGAQRAIRVAASRLKRRH
jgi:hypothetical protein